MRKSWPEEVREGRKRAPDRRNKRQGGRKTGGSYAKCQGFMEEQEQRLQLQKIKLIRRKYAVQNQQ